MHRLIDADSGSVVIPTLAVAGAFGVASARGLLGRRRLEPGEGLLLADPLRCVHTFGMRFPIDVVFLDRRLVVVAVAPAVPPWRLAGHVRGPRQLEIAAGAAAALGLVAGRPLRIVACGGCEPPESPHAIGASGDTAHDRCASPCDRRHGLRSIPPSDSRPTSQGARPCARTS
jgi:uncharacterized membrane protein (UPF0127 family)